MNSRTTRQFRDCFSALPVNIQQHARRSYRQFLVNPHHPGLQFKRVHASLPIHSVRIGIHYRALGVVTGNDIVWFWIGPHSEYDRIIAQI